MNLKHAFDEVYTLVKHRKVPFFMVFFLAVLLSYGVLFAIDFIPEPISEETKQARLKEEQEKAVRKEILVTAQKIGDAEIQDESALDAQKETQVEKKTEVAVSVVAVLPTRILIDTLGVDVKVHNPDSREVSVLDTALLGGVVRHPDSADFSKAGNMLILGHSSYLPNVMNKNFQAFNGIQKMTWGDKIRVQSEGKEYVYRVQKVTQAKASEIIVPFTPGKAMLTLATCNSFGSKEDRFIVEAVLIDSKEIGG